MKSYLINEHRFRKVFISLQQKKYEKSSFP